MTKKRTPDEKTEQFVGLPVRPMQAADGVAEILWSAEKLNVRTWRLKAFGLSLLIDSVQITLYIGGEFTCTVHLCLILS